MSGISYSGKVTEGQVEWDGLTNIKVWDYETSITLQVRGREGERERGREEKEREEGEKKREKRERGRERERERRGREGERGERDMYSKHSM